MMRFTWGLSQDWDSPFIESAATSSRFALILTRAKSERHAEEDPHLTIIGPAVQSVSGAEVRPNPSADP